MVSRARFNEGTREISFRYDILDKNNVKKGEASNIAEGKISFNAEASIHRTATFKLREEAPPPESVNIIAGNTYTTLNFPPIGWAMDSWVGTSGGQLLPQTARYGSKLINYEMEGETVSNSNGSTWEKWGTFKPNALTNIKYRTDENGCVGMAQTIEKNDTAYFQAGIVATEWRNTVVPPTPLRFCFMYKLSINNVASNNKPFVWVMPESANADNNWTGNIRVPDASMTIKVMNNGWVFCEGRYDSLTVLPYLERWKFAIGYETAGTFKMKISSVYIADFDGNRFINTCTSTSQVFDISYNTVVDGFSPTFRQAKIHFNTPPAQYNPAEVDPLYNGLYYQTSTDGGTNWSLWFPVDSGVNITTIPAGTSSVNLKMRLRWEFSRYSMGDNKPRMKDVRVEVTYNAKGKNPLTDSIDYRTDRIRPYMIYKDGGSTVERSLGIFLLNSPKRKDTGSRVYREIEAYDQLSILADAKVIQSFETQPDNVKPITQLITEILTGTDTTIKFKLGYSFPPAFVNITPATSGTLTRTLKFNVGETWLNVINAMLMFINYTPLYVDGNGVLRAEPYKKPSDRPVSHTYLDDSVSIIYKQAEEEYDIYNVPNVFVVVQKADAEGEALYSRIFNENEGSLSSVPNVGRYIVDYREVDQIENQGVLDTYCARIANEASQAYGKVIFRTALMPSHEYMNNIRLRYQNLRVDDVYTETDWSMDLKVGGQMEHRVRKVVRI